MSVTWSNIQAGLTDLWSHGAGTRESSVVGGPKALTTEKSTLYGARCSSTLWLVFLLKLLKISGSGMTLNALHTLSKILQGWGETDKKTLKSQIDNIIITQLLIQITWPCTFILKTEVQKSWTYLRFIIGIVVVVLKLIFIIGLSKWVKYIADNGTRFYHCRRRQA